MGMGMGMGDMDAMAQQLSQNPQMMAQIMQVTLYDPIYT